MTANQRRPGFRLPWSSETDAPTAEGERPTPAAEGSAEAAPKATGAAASQAGKPPAEAADADETRKESTTAATGAAAGKGASAEDGGAQATVAPTVEAETQQVGAAEAAPGDDFMRDLVAAMRRVADEAREAGLNALRAVADEQVRKLEADADKRREQLRARAETDVTGVGEWAKAEMDRIKAEAEQRVVARRAQLDQQLAGDTARTESETKAVRERVAEYERELAAYHSQLSEINDPAAFAAAAKRMPRPPSLGVPASREVAAATPAASAGTPAVEPATAGSNGVPTAVHEVHPAEEEVLAARLAELDATLPPSAEAEAAATAAPEPAPTATAAGEPTTTEVVVKGLGSFGAITGFRQALSSVDGIEGVALSLGQTGEFVFRATHAQGFDVRAAITALEGDDAKIEDRAEGGIRVTLDRAR